MSLVVITQKSGLHALLALRTPGRIELRLDGLAPEAARRWEARLNRHYSDCGCSIGALVLCTCLGVYALSLLLLSGPAAWPIWAKLGVGLSIALVSAGLGKAIGLERAHRQLRQAIDELIASQCRWGSARPLHAGPLAMGRS